MSLETVRQGAAIRFQEAQAFLSAIKSLEEEAKRPTDESNVRKGLFLVLLYGAFEYGLTRTLTEATALINACGVKYEHISNSLYGLALDPQLTSLAESGRDTKWMRRAEVFRVQICAEPVVLLEGAFMSDLQNAWSRTVQKAFLIFGITKPPLYDPKVKQYIDEVVEKRNAVAHGRESASATGQSYTTGDLQRLINELNNQMQYTFALFEEHLATKAFVKQAHQNLY